jgi:hypothetical protein
LASGTSRATRTTGALTFGRHRTITFRARNRTVTLGFGCWSFTFRTASWRTTEAAAAALTAGAAHAFAETFADLAHLGGIHETIGIAVHLGETIA